MHLRTRTSHKSLDVKFPGHSHAERASSVIPDPGEQMTNTDMTNDLKRERISDHWPYSGRKGLIVDLFATVFKSNILHQHVDGVFQIL